MTNETPLARPSVPLPCPFCGAPAEYDSRRWEPLPSPLGSTGHAVYCSGCNAENGLHETREEAFEAWNARAALSSPDDSAAPLEQVTPDNLARSCARPIRGCATDEQYTDVVIRIGAVIMQERKRADATAATIALYRDIFAEITAKAEPLMYSAVDSISAYKVPVGPIHRAAGKLGFQMFDGEKHLADALPEDSAPVRMVMFCPACGLQHVDAPDERTPGWTNPPHKSHLCHGCGFIWRPADVPTEGVAAIETRGEKDGPLSGAAASCTKLAERTAKAEAERDDARKKADATADKLAHLEAALTVAEQDKELYRERWLSCVTPEEATRLRDEVKSAADRLAALERELADSRAIVDRIWNIFGRPSYEALAGRSIYDLVQAAADAERERDELRELLSRPEIDDFHDGLLLEAAHQRQRWGDAHDRSKSAENWYWLVGYLAGKALRSAIEGDQDKARHHTISSAAALFQWWKAIKEAVLGIENDDDLDPERHRAKAAAPKEGD